MDYIEINPEDLVPGETYKLINNKSDYIFTFDKNPAESKFLDIYNDEYHSKADMRNIKNNGKYFKTTDEERIWLKYCIDKNKFTDKDIALENWYLIIFIEEQILH